MKDLTLISIKLSKDLLNRAKFLADEEDTTVSALVRRLLLEYLSRKDK